MSENSKNKKRIAIVLFNLGGPDSKKDVKDFLFNLFYDKNIITLPKYIRWFLAKLISTTREKTAIEIYNHLGGKSPILEETKLQREALRSNLQDALNDDFELFICMRYWHPMSNDVVKDVSKYNPSDILLVPLYPQFSTTTTRSSIEDFLKTMKNHNLKANVKIACCYPNHEKYIKAHTSLIKSYIAKLNDKNNFRILFSAHSLPVKIIKSGDPYQWQIEQSVNHILQDLDVLDYKITYQSKVGPIEWLTPSTEDEIKTACRENKSLIIVPISFVSEHSETLVELDIEYKELTNDYAIEYLRVPTLRINEFFISSLCDIIASMLSQDDINPCSVVYPNQRLCPEKFSRCAHNVDYSKL
ncbi:MAG: ferrochelatase [Rickettsiaceae bacterium]